MTGHRISQKHFKKEDLYVKYKCLSCKWLLKSAVQSAQCGHWFCQSCIEVLLKTSDPICPNCKESLKPDEDDSEGGPEYFPDKFVRRDIDALELYCIHKESGCVWEGRFGKMKDHLKDCPYAVCKRCCEKVSTEPDHHKCQGYTQPQDEQGHGSGAGESSVIFEDPVCSEKLICSECHLLLRDAVQPSCGHWLCQSCADAIIIREHEPNCPTCGKTFKPINKENKLYFADNCIRREVFNQQVKCSFHHKGCDQTMELRRLNEHMAVCNYGSETSSMGIAEKGFDEASSIAPESIRLQAELEVADTNEMKAQIAALQALVKQLEKKQCENHNFCLHLIENSNHDGTMVWKIPQFNQRMSDARCGKYTSIFSLPFYTGRYGYKMCLRLYILGDGIGKGSYMSLFFVIMKGEFDSILQWPFSHKVTFKLINQGDGRDVIDEFQPDPTSSSFQKPQAEMNTASGSPRFVPLTKLDEYVQNDTVFIKCTVDKPLIENSNHDGTMVWKIPQFNQQMNDAQCRKYTSIFSLPFYTGRYGYKMCLRLYILGDGIGKGSYMSLFFVIMRGEFDSILQWPFSHKVTFKLINQRGGRDVIDMFQPDPMSSSFRRPKSDMNIASGFPRFVSHTELNNGGYIVDDTIFIKCAVDITSIKHP